MPSSPFRDEGEPFKVMRVHSHESAIDPTGQPYIKAMLVITSDLSSDQGREFRITDGDMVRLSHMTDTPTPPDFDAALDVAAADWAALQWARSMRLDDVDLVEKLSRSRQRVRELYEAVVRERDALREERAYLQAPIVKLNAELAALRAAPQGEEMEIVGHRYHTDGRPTLTVAGLYGEQFQTGDRVRVVKVAE